MIRINKKKLGLIFLTLILSIFVIFQLSGRRLHFVQPTPSANTQTQVQYREIYRDVEHVSRYVHEYKKLPPNYITKKQAKKAGWNSETGNLWEVTDKKTIGGDAFGNYQEELPVKEKYHEADVNYYGGYRGSERIVYSDKGAIYYSKDHYKNFKRLY